MDTVSWFIVIIKEEHTRKFQKESTMSRINREEVKRTADVHRANIQKRLEQRLEVARSKGDENLIRLLEQEMQQL